MPTLRPSFIQVTDTAYKAGVVVGGNLACSDDSDATYAEQWLSIRSGVGDGPTALFSFDPATVTSVGDDAFRFRFETFNEAGGIGNHISVFLNSEGLEVGILKRDGASVVEVPANDTIYDWTGWEFEQTGSKPLAQAFRDGFDIRARRVESPSNDGDYGLRIYEITVQAEAGAVVRNYPRRDGLGFATASRNYPPVVPRGYGDAP